MPVYITLSWMQLKKQTRDMLLRTGDDRFTVSALEKFRDHFGQEAEVFFVFTGTAANVLGLKAVTRSFHAVICSNTAHLAMVYDIL
jgi:threonine aldolase